MAERAGVHIDTGCNTGSCGICEVNCLQPVLDRDPDLCSQFSQRTDTVSPASVPKKVAPRSSSLDSTALVQVEVRTVQAGGVSSSSEAPAVVRACIAKVPPGYERMEVSQLSDSIWGSDRWDT